MANQRPVRKSRFFQKSKTTLSTMSICIALYFYLYWFRVRHLPFSEIVVMYVIFLAVIWFETIKSLLVNKKAQK